MLGLLNDFLWFGILPVAFYVVGRAIRRVEFSTYFSLNLCLQPVAAVTVYSLRDIPEKVRLIIPRVMVAAR